MSTVAKIFGSKVFDDRVMKAKLPAKIYNSLKRTIDEGVDLDISVANAVAVAMKDWALHIIPTGFSPLQALPPKSMTAL